MSNHITRRGINIGIGAALVSPALDALPAFAQSGAPIKIGLIMTYSGQFADLATMMDGAIKLYMQKNGDTVAGKKIELERFPFRLTIPRICEICGAF